MARKHFNVGTGWFELGHFDEAIKEYEQAYRFYDDPVLLYNLAQAHRQAGHAADALRLYKVYLSRAPTASNRSEVETKMAALEKLLEDQRRSQNLPPDHALRSTPPPTTPPEPSTVKAQTPPTTAATVQAHPARPSEAPAHVDEPVPGRSKKIAGIAVAVVGLGAVAGGIAFGVLAKQAGDAVTADAQAHNPFNPSKESSGRTDQIVGPVLLGVGAAAVVAGGVLYYLGHREARRAGRSGFVLAPVAAPAYAGAMLRGAF